ncbi:MAG: hypothetical protein FJ347_06350 [Sphingomonadales bacterium]|nr:hypothetical protein [Sphingomonadales bacterium]
MSARAFSKQIILTAFWSLTTLLQAQNISQYYIRAYNKENNQISENIISDLRLDENKTLWIATPNGLFTFDGAAIELYPKEIPERIISIFQDRSKKMYITCVDKKIYQIGNDSISQYHFLSDKLSAAYSAQLYGASKAIGLKNEKLLGDSQVNAGALFVSSDNKIYLRRKNVIYVIDKGVFKTITKTFPAGGKDIFVDDKYWIYNPKDGKMHCINNGNLKDVYIPIRPEIAGNAKWFMKHDATPLLITEKYAWTFFKNQQTGQYEWREVADNIPDDAAIYSALYSPELNKLFLGTIPSGLIVISKSRFSIFQHSIPKNTIDFYRYYVQIPQKSGNIISDYPQLAKNTPEYFRSFFENYDISYSYQNLDSTNIIGNTRDFYYTLDIKTLKPRKISKQPAANLQHQSYVLYGNKVYIFNSNGIFIYDRTKDSIYLQLKMNIGYGLINQSIVINDKIFLSYCGGILVYDPKKNSIVTHISKPTCFRYFFRYKSQIIVTTFGEGLHLLDTLNYKVKSLKNDHFNALKRTHFLYNDKNNFVWASTTDGILRIPGFSFDKLLVGGDLQPQPQYFDSKNGLPNDEMNGGTYPAYINFGDTMFSAPSLMGIIQLHPLRDFPARTAGRGIRIKTISSLGKSLSIINGTINLSSVMNEVKFHIQTAHWDNPKNLNLYYRLNNKLHYISYKELSSLGILFEDYGEHSLAFLYLDDFGKETIVNTFTILKEKPWYLKWSYIIVFVVFVIGSILIISKIRTRSIEKKNIELQLIIDDKTQEIRKINESLIEKIAELTQLDKINNIYISVINHDIFAPIKYINMVGDKVHDFQGKLKKAEVIKYMELIINSTKRLEILCSNILNDRSAGGSFARFKKDISVHKMLSDLKKFIKIGLDINHNQLIVNVPENAFATSSENALNIVLTNIISNANRFTKDGKISVSYSKSGSKHNITVADTGTGMPADMVAKIQNRTLQVNHKDGTEFQSYGIGYSLIFKMLDIIKGELSVSSEPLKGTSVTIAFPDIQSEE